MRIGHGYDVHRYKAGRKCIICGVEIPCDFGPDGHSDADVAIHALIDAMLGAAAMGDIGKWFPDDDEQYAGADSMKLLLEVNDMIKKAGFSLGNADITIIAQKPKLSQYIEKMRANIARTLSSEVGNINVKATTEEGLGFTGELKGIAAHAVVILE